MSASDLTPSEQAAFARLVSYFPEAEELPFEPREPAPPKDAGILEEAAAALLDPDAFELVPVDFQKLLAEGIPETEYLAAPYIPRATRIWIFGPAESVKTLFMQWMSAKLTREGLKVVFVSQENPLATDVDRIGRLKPAFENLTYFHMPGLDLANHEHFLELALACQGRDLIVIDTLSASWSGDEQSNADVVKLDREVLAQLVRLTGVTPAVIHHTGHPQAFANRGGAGARRGASAMGQKADVVLVFQSVGPHEFTVEHAKNRTPGGYKEPRARYQVVDTEEGGLDIVRTGTEIDPRVTECMDVAVEIVLGSDGTLGTNALKVALNDRGFGGSTVTPALAELKSEDPPRVRQIDGVVVGADGKRRKGRPWVRTEG